MPDDIRYAAPIRRGTKTLGGFLRPTDIALEEAKGGVPSSSGQVLGPAKRKIIGTGHAIAALEKRVGQLAADEAGGAGDEMVTHLRIPAPYRKVACITSPTSD